MGLLRQARHNPLAWWWVFLVLAGIGNIVLWFSLSAQLRGQAHGGRPELDLMMGLCAAYVFGCAFRSFLPRADVQRFCLFDTWLSNAAVGRAVATVAEVSFAAQWAIVMHHLGTTVDAPAVSAVGWVIVPLIVVAQCCSWYGIVTGNCLANAIENSIWAVAFGLVAMALVRLLPEFDGVAQQMLILTLGGIMAYLVFLITVDVPMYVGRWREDVARGAMFLPVLAGLRDASSRRVVTYRLSHWRGEIAWMSLYFTVAVWASLALSYVYAHADRLDGYRSVTSADRPVTVRGFELTGARQPDGIGALSP